MARLLGNKSSQPNQLAQLTNFLTVLKTSPIWSYTMALQKFDGLELPAPADFHVHLRDGPMMELVTPTIRQGGVNTVFVMVSLTILLHSRQRERYQAHKSCSQ